VDEARRVEVGDRVLDAGGRRLLAGPGLLRRSEEAIELGEAPEAGLVADDQRKQRLLELDGIAECVTRDRLVMHGNSPSCAGPRAVLAAPGPFGCSVASGEVMTR
jgi:hypothetical protein